MKLVSFNTNSVRVRIHQLQALIDQHNPDIIGLQETKVSDEDFPIDDIQSLGYQVFFHGQKGHYGVALLTKSSPENVYKGYPSDKKDAQRRFIAVSHKINSKDLLTVINCYFPQGENRDHETKFPAKKKFYADLLRFLTKHYSPQDNIIIMGDFNIAPEDSDIGIGKENTKRWLKTGKCAFLPEERQWLQKLFTWGFVDTFRQDNPAVKDKFSWFDYRSKGFDSKPKRGLRIDLVLATASMSQQCQDTGIAYDIRAMERPSDHCPVWAKFEI